MNTLPESVINKIMLYNSHPIADIIKESSIFQAMQLERRGHIQGSPFDRGICDAFYGREFLPHKWVNGDHRSREEIYDDEEHDEYCIGYDHHMDRKYIYPTKGELIEIKYRFCPTFKIKPAPDPDTEEEDDSDSDSDSD